MKKILLSFLVITGFATYIIYAQKGNSLNYVATSTLEILSQPVNIPVSNEIPSVDQNQTLILDPEQTLIPATTPKAKTIPPIQVIPPATKQKSSGRYKDGSYIGDSADAFYGNVQVKIIIQGGKITDVQFLDHPKDNPTSRGKSAMAMPILKSETLTAQSAKVNSVSRAALTSRAFVESLSSALVQAKI